MVNVRLRNQKTRVLDADIGQKCPRSEWDEAPSVGRLSQRSKKRDDGLVGLIRNERLIKLNRLNVPNRGS